MKPAGSRELTAGAFNTGIIFAFVAAAAER